MAAGYSFTLASTSQRIIHQNEFWPLVVSISRGPCIQSLLLMFNRCYFSGRMPTESLYISKDRYRSYDLSKPGVYIKAPVLCAVLARSLHRLCTHPHISPSAVSLSCPPPFRCVVKAGPGSDWAASLCSTSVRVGFFPQLILGWSSAAVLVWKQMEMQTGRLGMFHMGLNSKPSQKFSPRLGGGGVYQ